MNLLKFLKQRKPEYKPQNRLESLLEEAANHPAARPDFMRQLFHFDLLTIGKLTENPDASKSAQFFVRRDQQGVDYVSSFTSMAALEFAVAQDKALPKNYIGLKTDVLFGMVQNRLGICLNPGLPYGKFFNPGEVESVLSGEFSKITTESKDRSDFFLGIPNQLPVKFIEALKGYVGRTPVIENIYFGLHHTSEKDSLAYRLAVDFKEGFKPADPTPIFKDIGMIALDLNLDRPIDMLVADERERDYFKNGNLISVV